MWFPGICSGVIIASVLNRMLYLMYASDPRQKGNLARKVVQALLEKVERRYRLIQALIHLRQANTISFNVFSAVQQVADVM